MKKLYLRRAIVFLMAVPFALACCGCDVTSELTDMIQDFLSQGDYADCDGGGDGYDEGAGDYGGYDPYGGYGPCDGYQPSGG